ncbi:hypothetical protein KI688_008441 [Linnemannia hyalina]|uniref:Uncharacterized protein n=1 Tax=Linnemannia hyalina TaxID=64524 RepID=A0A9P8BVV8_9FUNG|nr:hypothetical protein KI688_008441 [Linnemannia hyalina]
MSAESIDSSTLTSADNKLTHSHQNRPRKHSADSRNRREVIALDGQMFESAPAQEDPSAAVLHLQNYRKNNNIIDPKGHGREQSNVAKSPAKL